MPQMFIERRDEDIREDEWRRAVESAPARFVPGTLDVELRNRDGEWQRVLRWERNCATFSVMSYHDPFIEPMRTIAQALGALIVDNDGALYFWGSVDPFP